MKTPDEIKKGLKHCRDAACIDCPYKKEKYCWRRKNCDALAYITQLETRLAELEKVEDVQLGQGGEL